MGAKYIFVTGGVVSSLGKGITAASLGRLLKNRGVGVFMQKFDPYINMDPGRMSPLQHGEVFVTDDGVEADLDLGHYERFIDVSLNTNSTVTSGKIYWSILNRELQNGFNGKTVQVIPHVTNAIKERVYASGNQEGVDVVITEIGGTVGDIESLPFLEAIRQISNEVGNKNCMFIHATLLPYLSKAGELKTKPTQHSVKEMRSIGIQPDVIVCRTETTIAEDIKKKIALFCNVPERNVVENIDADDLYEVPLLLEKEHLDDIVVDHLGLDCGKADMTQWIKMINNAKNSTKKVKIALVGQYVELHDAYLSISEALSHAGHVYNADVEIKWIQSDDVTADTVGDLLGDVDGILVPPGEEKSGVDGNILAVKYARENNVPFLGITLGMHCAVVEFARNVLGLSGADSTQFNATPADAVIVKGSGTRKGAYPCKLTKGSMFEAIYGANDISERHRHAYEVNSDYAEKLEAAGFKVAGICPDNSYIEALELEGHPFFVGVQFNSEYKSRPTKPHPLFLSFIKAIINKK